MKTRIIIACMALLAMFPLVHGPQIRASEPTNTQKQKTEIPAGSNRYNSKTEPSISAFAIWEKPEQEPASDNKNQTYDPLADCLYHWYLLATIIGVGGGIVGLIFLIVQTMATKKAANAALLNAQAVINAERPWITITVEQSQSDSQVFIFVATIKGRTPARIITGDATHEFIADVFKLKSPPVYDSPILEPPETLLVDKETFNIYPVGVNPVSIIEQRKMTSLIDGANLFVVFYGRLVYEDMFPKDGRGYEPHETRWCYVYSIGDKRLKPTGPEEYRRKS